VDEVYARIQRQERTSEGLVYIVADGDTIQIEGEGYRLRRNGTNYCFAGNGLLQRIDFAAGNPIIYDWDGPYLRSISDGSGLRYMIVRDASRRIERIDCADGTTLSYKYDQAGWLAATTRDDSLKSAYRYDQHGRLTEIRDRADVVVRRISYDARGSVRNTSDRCDGPQGAWIERHFKSDRLASVSDHRGWQADYGYGKAGEIRSIAVQSDRQPLFTLHYDDAGMLYRVSDQNGHVDLAYEGNNVRELTRSDGVRIRFDHDPDSRSIICEDLRGERWLARLDADDMVTEIVGPGEERLRIRRRPGDLFLRSTTGQCRLKQKRERIVMQTKMRGGPIYSATLGTDEISIRKKSRWIGRTQSEMTISSANGTSTLRDAAGTIEWRSDPKEATVRVKVAWFS
jgi:YD repeat-containing protein